MLLRDDSRARVFRVLTAAAFVCVAGQAHADLFDVSEGAQVTEHSDLTGGEFAEEILGLVPDTGPEQGTLIFEDGNPKGTVHSIEWEMPEPVKLGRIRLYAAGDSCSGDNRTFDRFRLLADLGGENLEPLVDEAVAVPYEYLVDCSLLLAMATPTVESARFRAEFTQFRMAGYEGPRVMELDGFPPALCGDPTLDEKVSATDALSVLKSGVGVTYCEGCICDATDDDAVTAGDALLVLRYSVGQPVSLNCPACPLSSIAAAAE